MAAVFGGFIGSESGRHGRAAGMWATAAIGIAVGYGFYTAAVLATAICIFTATVLSHLDKNRKNLAHFYAEICDTKLTGKIVENICSMETAFSVELTNPKSNCQGHVGLLIDIKNDSGAQETKNAIASLEGIDFIVEEMS